ncbi:NAD(P)H-dependent oxidoreductase [bacterium]|jgi:chromate reductase, NAD(P)H dehydrogenase (quinone)|nr:NAD(P)H-dependent oxidoreductase [bacterium]
MKQITILLSSQGQNAKVADAFNLELKKHNNASSIIDLVSLDLPLYSGKEHKKNGIPKRVSNCIQLLNETDAFIFVAPEYNGGIPPVLSNFIAWISVSQKDWRGAFNNKPAVISSFSASCGHHMLSSLRTQLSHIGMNVLGREITASFKKELNLESVEHVCASISGAQ